jgi:Domain of unknown function (DUF1707)/FHA domain
MDGFPPPRVSDGDRDRVLRSLRDRVADGRLSHETFERRVDVALRAHSQAELSSVVCDLPPSNGLVRRLTGAVTSLSEMTARIEAAWRVPRLPRFALPPAGLQRLLIGRAPGCQFILADLTVSRRHAELARGADGWMIADLGSMNGTRVNGWRITGPTPVRPGDEIGFGKLRFIVG